MPTFKVLANEDTLFRTHCCRHKCFPVCPRAQHLLRTQILCPGYKNVFDFVQKHFVSATNVSQFTRARKRHEQQCFHNNVSSFATAFTQWWDPLPTHRCIYDKINTKGIVFKINTYLLLTNVNLNIEKALFKIFQTVFFMIVTAVRLLYSERVFRCLQT